MYKKIITATAWRRPDYTLQVVNALKNCIGFEDYLILPTIEPGNPAVSKIFDDLPNCEVIINEHRLGCATNTLKALQRGFDLSDFVVHIEDDTVPGIDSLKYFEWIYKRYKEDNEIFTATAYNRISKIDYKNYFSVYRCPWFTGWVWATWRDRFEEMKEKWDFNAWDIGINKKIRGHRYEICPDLPRSINVGEYLGTYVTPSHWRRHQHSDIWVNNAPDISNILSSNVLPSNLSHDINGLAYFESTSNNNVCPTECNDIAIGIMGIIGIAYLYQFYEKNKIVA